MNITKKDIAKGAINTAETLAKYGVKGAGMLVRCGCEASGMMMKEVGSLAQEFSGCGLGNTFGEYFMKKTQGAVNTITNKAESLMFSGISYAATQARNQIR